MQSASFAWVFCPYSRFFAYHRLKVLKYAKGAAIKHGIPAVHICSGATALTINRIGSVIAVYVSDARQPILTKS
jgi:hypothetical protein